MWILCHAIHAWDSIIKNHINFRYSTYYKFIQIEVTYSVLRVYFAFFVYRWKVRHVHTHKMTLTWYELSGQSMWDRTCSSHRICASNNCWSMEKTNFFLWMKYLYFVTQYIMECICEILFVELKHELNWYGYDR